MALKEQEQKQQQKQKQKKFYVVKRRSVHNIWLPVAYFDDNNNFRGYAVFDDFFPAVKYMKKYEDKLTRKYLEDGKNGGGSKRYHNANSDKELKIFFEDKLPSIGSSINSNSSSSSTNFHLIKK